MNIKQNPYSSLTRRNFMKYGIYGSLAAGLLPGFFWGGCGKKKYPNIILITLDTTRVDHLSCYGYNRRTTPNIDKLAEESVLYTNAIAPSSWTLPSHASLFTGKFVSSHGAEYDPEGPLRLTDAISGPKGWQAYRARGLAHNELSLASILKGVGYITGAVVAGPWLKKIFGMNKGFDYYDDDEISSLNGRLARQVTGNALKWIDKIKENKFFLFLNYFDPHGPYMPPEGYAWSFLPKNTDLSGIKSTSKEIISLYDSEILYMDHYIGELIEKLKTDNLYNYTMIIVTADHGELFGEHNKIGHGHYLYQEEIHIPLLIKYPGTEVSPTQRNMPIQLNDIMAIILERLRIKIPVGIQSGVPPQIGHPVLAETHPLSALSQDGHWCAIFKGSLKFIWNSIGAHLLFNLKDDPHEEKNLALVKPQLQKSMMSDLNHYLSSLPVNNESDTVHELDENTKNAIKSLGYIE